MTAIVSRLSTLSVRAGVIGALVVSVATSLTLSADRTTSTACHRIVAMGDLHGGYDVFVQVITEAGLVDDALHWIAEDSCLVQTGDVIDRGADSRRLLELVIALQREAPQHVFPVLGNHEIMNIVSDLRYVFPSEYAAYAVDETEKDREWGFGRFVADATRRTTPDQPAASSEPRAKFDEEYPAGWFSHRRVFAEDGAFGAWLLTRPIVVKIGRSVFLHGGLSPADAKRGVGGLNARAKKELTQFLGLRERLVEAGLVSPLAPYKGLFQNVADLLALGDGKTSDPSIRKHRSAAKKFVELQTASVFRADGPVWNRDLAKLDEEAHMQSVLEVLKGVDADRIVVGHSVQEDGKITSRFGGRVLLIDTGAGPYYGDHASALEIVGDVVRALYPGQDPLTLGD